MNKNGFAPILIILIIVILGVVGYLGYKSYYTSNNSVATSRSNTFSPKPIQVNAEISNVNGSWMLYKNLTYKFSFEFPVIKGAKLGENNMQIDEPLPPRSDGFVDYWHDISISYFDNSQNLDLGHFIISTYNSYQGNKDAGYSIKAVSEIGYQKYSPEGNNLEVYINRTAPGADTNQSFYVLSPDGKFILEFACFLKTSDVNHILSSLKFLN